MAAAGAAVWIAGGPALAAPVHVVHPPVPAIIPHPAPVPPPVHVVMPPAPPPPMAHVVIPPAPPPPVAHVVVPPAAPPLSEAHAAAVPDMAPSAVQSPAPLQHLIRAHSAPTAATARPPTRTFDPLAPVTQDPGLNWPSSPPRSAHPAVRLPHPPTARPAPVIRRLRLPPPPPARPVQVAASPTKPAAAPPTPSARPSAAAAIEALPPATTQAAADPPSPASAPSVVSDAGAAAIADPERRAGLSPQPSGRLPLPRGLIEALTAPLTFVPDHAVGAPAPAAAAAEVDAPAAAAAPRVDHQAAASERDARPARPAPEAQSSRRLFDSPSSYLMSHLMPVAPSPFAQPEHLPVTDLWADRPWPFGSSQLSNSSAAVAALVVAALIAMTALTTAGAAISGRRLRHTAWRAGRVRHRAGSPWDLGGTLADETARRLTPGGEAPVAPWPQRRPAAEEALQPDAARRRRVA